MGCPPTSFVFLSSSPPHQKKQPGPTRNISVFRTNPTVEKTQLSYESVSGYTSPNVQDVRSSVCPCHTILNSPAGGHPGEDNRVLSCFRVSTSRFCLAVPKKRDENRNMGRFFFGLHLANHPPTNSPPGSTTSTILFINQLWYCHCRDRSLPDSILIHTRITCL